MTRFQFFRKWISFLKKSQISTDVFVLLLILGFFCLHLPAEILNADPATGGDTGSHFWPLVTLVKQGLPHFHVRVWNPGNLGGEPHLTHYFPAPYLMMAFLSLWMPLGKAFNFGTALPMALFPICVYFCFRGLRLKFPLPILAAVASLSFLYNESFSMWGGNALSTLAGQFAHLYALCFFLLGVGSLNWELSKKRFPIVSTFLFGAVLLSHFYVALYIPIVFAVFLFCHPVADFKWRFLNLVATGFGALGLSAWFVVPMLHNSPWNTAFGLKWASSEFFHEAFPRLFWPFSVLAIVAFALLLNWRRFKLNSESILSLVLFSALALSSLVYFYFFPKWGLVDIRVIPTVQLAICLSGAMAIGFLMRFSLPKPWLWFLTLPILAIAFWWPVRSVTNLGPWMKWNYSSWPSKPAYPDLQKLTQSLKGDFSQGRVIYENSELSNSAGTMRVFEMLPYFSGRATLESVYMQATILAPATFYLQALISETPSCPFPNYQCASHQVPQVEKYLKLMAVSDLILITVKVLEEADQSSFLRKGGDFGLWHTYQMKQPPPLVETLNEAPKFIPFKDYKRTFYEWFLSYQEKAPFLVAMSDSSVEKESEKITAASIADLKVCHPNLKVDFNRIELTTDCPGRMHYLKFAFHPTWKASTGDSLYLVSPGFIGLIPSEKTVVLTWGQHWLWTFSVVLSWTTFLFLSIIMLWKKLRSRRAK